MDIILSAGAGDPPWAALIRERTGHSPGAVAPALERLEAAGWIKSHWEDPKPRTRPRRRYYTPTDAGRHECARARARQTPGATRSAAQETPGPPS
jgi:DNA-binding PadR family transcriptional regulator